MALFAVLKVVKTSHDINEEGQIGFLAQGKVPISNSDVLF